MRKALLTQACILQNLKIIVHAAGNIYKGQQSTKEASNYIPSYSPGHREFESLGFVSIAQTVSESRAFVCNVISVNETIIIYSGLNHPIDKHTIDS